jgi:hypothetical protein
MIGDDDKRFYELSCKQAIHRKLKDALARRPERVYDREDLDRKPESPQEIEAKYEEFLDVIKKVKKVA